MEFDVYCDESYPDLFSSSYPPVQYLAIGSLWLPRENRTAFKEALHGLRDKYHFGGEFKWKKVSPSKLDFFKEAINWFVNQGEMLRFRCIVIDHNRVDLVRYHDNDPELGFYKFYYQLLHHWIDDFNDYMVFCDLKVNRKRDQLHVLQNCLQNANLSSEVTEVQAVRSEESVLIQLTDVLTGMTAASLNKVLRNGSAKRQLADHFEKRLGRPVRATWRDEKKFNVFVMGLKGGW